MQIVRECDPIRWNTLIESTHTGYITQMWEWGQLSHLGAMHRLAVADDEGVYLAAISLIEVRAPVIGRSYLYAPRGPVCDDPASPALLLLLQAVEELAHQRGAFMLKIEPEIADGDQPWLAKLRELKFRVNPYATHPRRSWMLDIRPDLETLRGGMKTSSRYNINRGQRKLHIRVGQGPEDRAHFYRIYTATAKRDNFFIHPQSHYDEMFDIFEAKGRGRLWLAEYQGTPIAAQVAMTCGKVTTSMFSASSNEHREQRPNHLLQWTAIQWAKEHGSETYDFRAIAEVLEQDQELYGLFTYKSGYGGYSWLSLVTHDYPYNAALYWAYRQALNLKRRQDRQRFLKAYHLRKQDKQGTEAKESAE